MNDETNIRLVDAHAESYRGHHDLKEKEREPLILITELAKKIFTLLLISIN